MTEGDKGAPDMACRTDTPTLIKALQVLAAEIESDDGVANAAIAEGAQRLQELAQLARDMVDGIRHPVALRESCPGCRLTIRYRHLALSKDQW
ncbi:MAG: hypothetical protein ABTR92_19805 [Candidatus Accumulibacter phosphatis]